MKKSPEPQPANPKHLGDVANLEFQKVGFKHQTAQQRAIEDINFAVEKGETIAFVGPSGSGKTTLMKLLVGLYRPEQGKILYNGVDETSINFEDLRNQIGFVTQDTQLFSGTIRENLLFVNPSATDEDLEEVIKRGIKELKIKIDKPGKQFLKEITAGDARMLLNTLEIAATQVVQKGTITRDTIEQAVQKKALMYDKAGEEHYNTISAFIKSMRASNIDASLYYLARM